MGDLLIDYLIKKPNYANWKKEIHEILLGRRFQALHSDTIFDYVQRIHEIVPETKRSESLMFQEQVINELVNSWQPALKFTNKSNTSHYSKMIEIIQSFLPPGGQAKLRAFIKTIPDYQGERYRKNEIVMDLYAEAILALGVFIKGELLEKENNQYSFIKDYQRILEQEIDSDHQFLRKKAIIGLLEKGLIDLKIDDIIKILLKDRKLIKGVLSVVLRRDHLSENEELVLFHLHKYYDDFFNEVVKEMSIDLEIDNRYVRVNGREIRLSEDLLGIKSLTLPLNSKAEYTEVKGKIIKEIKELESKGYDIQVE